MNFKNFKKLLNIDFIESSNCYGHHPMQLAAVNKKSELELNALMHLKTNAKKLFPVHCLYLIIYKRSNTQKMKQLKLMLQLKELWVKSAQDALNELRLEQIQKQH